MQPDALTFYILLDMAKTSIKKSNGCNILKEHQPQKLVTCDYSSLRTILRALVGKAKYIIKHIKLLKLKTAHSQNGKINFIIPTI